MLHSRPVFPSLAGQGHSASEEDSDATGDEVLASKKKEKKRRSFNHRKWRNPSISSHQSSSSSVSVQGHHLAPPAGRLSSFILYGYNNCHDVDCASVSCLRQKLNMIRPEASDIRADVRCV